MPALRLLVAACAIAAAAPALAETRSFDLPPFRAVDIASGINATVVAGAATRVEAIGEAGRGLDDLIVEVSNGTLHARLRNQGPGMSIFDLFNAFDRRQVRLTITAPAIDAVNASSGADVDVDTVSGPRVEIDASSGANLDVGNLAGDAVDINVSSGASVRLAGACGALSVDVSSGADLKARALECRTGDINASSGASVAVFISEAVEAEASSAGNIDIFGKPRSRDVNASSGGDVDFPDTP